MRRSLPSLRPAAILACLALGAAHPAFAAPADESASFRVLERTWDPEARSHEYRVVKARGVERRNNSLNRLSIVSENQYDYPGPDSGCGPTAILNILTWYSRYGLIEAPVREADAAAANRLLFDRIDARTERLTGMRRTERRGMSELEMALVLDDFVRELSGGRLRLHVEVIRSPLDREDLLATMPNFRAGILLVRPRHPETGELMDFHAATLIRADRAGYLSVATWGEIYNGLLRKKPEGQWFVPRDPEQLEMKVFALLRLVPFEPASQGRGAFAP